MIPTSRGERRLAAIMFTDLVGYSALSRRNENTAMDLLDEHRAVVRSILARHNGREVKTIGDAFLVEFDSALAGVRCAFEIQRTFHEINASRPDDRRITLRIGVHVGDVVHSGSDVYGDAVNVASRVESLAPPGGICVTGPLHDQVRNLFELPMTSLGEKELKNVDARMEVFLVLLPWQSTGGTPYASLRTETNGRLAVLPLKNLSPDPTDEYFAEGLTEELITGLSRVRGLTVIARTSVVQYKAAPKRVSDIGRELNVGSLIEGSVRKAGNRMRVTIQLVDAQTEGHLWGQNYDRQLDDVFAIQSNISESVVGTLSRLGLASPLGPRAAKTAGTVNVEAYMNYLKGTRSYESGARE